MMWTNVGKINFGVYKVTQNFSPTAMFSSIKLDTEQCRSVPLKCLVHFEKKFLMAEENGSEHENAAVHMLLGLLNHNVTVDVVGDIEEKGVMKELVKKVLVGQCRQIKYESWVTYEYESRPASNIKLGALGIGSKLPGKERW